MANSTGKGLGFLGVFFGGLFGTVAGMFLVFLLCIAMLAGLAATGSKEGPKVPETAALIISPSGLLVEQLTEVDPVSQMLNEMSGGSTPEVAARDIIKAIDRAADDDRIKVLVLYLDKMAIPSWYTSKAFDVADAIERFSAKDKKVIAIGDGYSQGGYLLAAHADEIWMHPFGGILITGFERNRVYYRSMLEKLKVTIHPFKVGEFKSAIEPMTRDSMSDSAKEANLAFLGDMWAAYTQRIEAKRNLEAGTIQATADNIDTILAESNGDLGAATLKAGLVDALKERDEWRSALIAMVGQDEDHKSFNQISLKEYLKATKDKEPKDKKKVGNVAVITASGSIVDGEAPVGTIGGDSVSRLIRKAYNDENTKAIVLRVDSGGGSAFASEIIRRDLLVAKEKGIPVVASMGSVAASGGYWISMSADEIWAAPTTVTGSIGVIGAFMTFENTADWAGVHSDGVGTTKLAGAFDQMRPMDPMVASLIQQSVEDIYEKFVNQVAASRNLSVDHVREIAEGRVWSGEDAMELGLIDKFGGLDDAVASAAKLAELEEFDVVHIKKKPSEFEQFIKELTGDAKAAMGWSVETADPAPAAVQILQRTARDLEPFLRMNDPNHVYLLCEECEVN